MKGGKKKRAGEGGENGGVAFSGDDVAPDSAPGEEEDEREVEEREETEPPKLPEGFYLIETIRKKRLQKGKTQYLVKWRDWPETANTWEPKENLMSCSDYIDAFEESYSLGSRKHSAGRRGKRKKQHQQSSPAAANDNAPPVGTVEAPDVGPTKKVEVSNQAMDKVETCLSVDAILVPTQDKDAKANQEGKLVINFSDKPQKIDDVAQGLPGCRIGSRKRKSGSVKKFTAGSVSNESMELQDGMLVSIDGGFGKSVNENKFNFSNSAPIIIGIVKPMSYSKSMADNAGDISITFVATRSDGKEVVVDNKFLKANNPLLLINFYEEHLRYDPTQ